MKLKLETVGVPVQVSQVSRDSDQYVGSTGLICLRIPQVPYLITKPFALCPLNGVLLKPA